MILILSGSGGGGGGCQFCVNFFWSFVGKNIFFCFCIYYPCSFSACKLIIAFYIKLTCNFLHILPLTSPPPPNIRGVVPNSQASVCEFSVMTSTTRQILNAMFWSCRIATWSNVFIVSETFTKRRSCVPNGDNTSGTNNNKEIAFRRFVFWYEFGKTRIN